jgi:hypothetical protein
VRGALCGAERHSCSWAVWFVRAFSACRCGGDAGCVLAYRTGDSPGCVVRGEALSGVRHSSPGIVARRCSSAPVLLHDCECRTLRRISVRPVPPDTPGVRASVCPGIRTSARYEAARCRRSAGRARPANSAQPAASQHIGRLEPTSSSPGAVVSRETQCRAGFRWTMAPRATNPGHRPSDPGPCRAQLRCQTSGGPILVAAERGRGCPRRDRSE